MNAFSSMSCQLISRTAHVTSFGDNIKSVHLKPSVSGRPGQMTPVNPRMYTHWKALGHTLAAWKNREGFDLLMIQSPRAG